MSTTLNTSASSGDLPPGWRFNALGVAIKPGQSAPRGALKNRSDAAGRSIQMSGAYTFPGIQQLEQQNHLRHKTEADVWSTFGSHCALSVSATRGRRTLGQSLPGSPTLQRAGSAVPVAMPSLRAPTGRQSSRSGRSASALSRASSESDIPRQNLLHHPGHLPSKSDDLQASG
mmetsp:Transcript_112572/g.313150  ORF Transcript_112572/g.313150 Transcript_112572/m.313150 type:complete len:173 (-) Transcript_112572:54-572(-)